MKEHKKLYKAGKNWVTATLLAAAVAIGGLYTTTAVHADSAVAQQIDQTDTAAPATEPVQSSLADQPAISNQDSNQTPTREQLEQQIESAQQDVNQKQQAVNEASDSAAMAASRFNAASNAMKTQRYSNARQSLSDAVVVNNELEEKLNAQISSEYASATSEMNSQFDEKKKADSAENQAYEEQEKAYDAWKAQSDNSELYKKWEDVYAEYSELLKKANDANSNYGVAQAKFSEINKASTSLVKMGVNGTHKKWLYTYYEFDDVLINLLSKEDQNKYNTTINIIKKNEAFIDNLENRYLLANHDQIQANKDFDDAKTALQTAQQKLADLKAQLAALPSDSGSSSSSAAQPSDSGSASSSAAQPSDSGSSRSSAAQPSDSGKNNSANIDSATYQFKNSILDSTPQLPTSRVAQSDRKQLPQTGDRQNMVAVAGFILVGFTTMFGLGKLKKK
ncbi:KxYKxGKxW signal peptide domain-containing protein [Lactobacillaceae bacterium 24-114]